jgi:hypothetical protein
MFDKLDAAQTWLYDQYSVVKTWSLDQILTIKLWMLIIAILGTGLLSSLGTLSLIYVQQALQTPKTISTVVPSPICPVCPTCSHPVVQNTMPMSHHSKLWDYKPLSTKGGKSY